MKITKNTLKRVIKEEFDKLQQEVIREKPLQLYWVKSRDENGQLDTAYSAVIDDPKDLPMLLSSGYIWLGRRPARSYEAVPMTPEEQERFMKPDNSMEAAVYGIQGNVPRRGYSGAYDRPKGSLGGT